MSSRLAALEENKKVGGREFWRYFRELMVPKWSQAFHDAIFRATGLRRFTYVTAVTRLFGDRRVWERHKRFHRAVRGNPIKLITLEEMVAQLLPTITKTPASSDLGRTLQLLKASGILSDHTTTGHVGQVPRGVLSGPAGWSATKEVGVSDL